MTTNTDRTKLIARVQALLDKAASTGFTAEAESFRAKADELMTKYIIEEHELRLAADPSEREAPTRATIFVASPGSPIGRQMATLAMAVADYCRCRILFHNLDSKRIDISAWLWGFPTDIDYFNMIFTSLSMQMANEMEPKPDPARSDVDNYEVLRMAGVPGARMAEVTGWPLSKVKRVRAEWMKVHGTGNFAVAASTYVRSFAIGFTNEVRERLVALRHQAETTSTSTALVLADRSHEVDAAYEDNVAGMSIVRRSGPSHRTVGAAIGRGREAGSRADLGQSRVSTGRRGALGA